MTARLLFCLAVLLSVTGCRPDPRQVEICRAILPALLAQDEVASDLTADADPKRPNTVILRFRTLTSVREMSCRFGGNLPSPEHLSLYGVTLDGMPLSFPRMIFLWRAFGLTPPAALVASEPSPPPMTPGRALAYFLQQLVNGLTLGAVLALIAVGYSLVYGVTGTIQFAFGEVFMIGAYLMIIFFFALAMLGVDALPLVLMLTAWGTIGITAAYGWSIDRLVYRPLRQNITLAPLIAAIGLSIALREYVRLAQGAGNRWLPNLVSGRLVLLDDGNFSVIIGGTQIFIVALAISTAIALGCFVMGTGYGRAQRACADDPVMAALLGVDVDRTIALTFALGAALAALAGLVVALYYGEADPNMGYLAGFKALTAALLGGFGSITGALLGGLMLGLFEAFWSGYLGLAYKDAAIFGVLILVLIFRPQGLLGTATNPRDAGALAPAR